MPAAVELRAAPPLFQLPAHGAQHGAKARAGGLIWRTQTQTGGEFIIGEGLFGFECWKHETICYHHFGLTCGARDDLQA